MTTKNPVHPGEILREDVLADLGLSVSEAASRLGVPRVTLSRVLMATGLVAALRSDRDSVVRAAWHRKE